MDVIWHENAIIEMIDILYYTSEKNDANYAFTLERRIDEYVYRALSNKHYPGLPFKNKRKLIIQGTDYFVVYGVSQNTAMVLSIRDGRQEDALTRDIF